MHFSLPFLFRVYIVRSPGYLGIYKYVGVKVCIVSTIQVVVSMGLILSCKYQLFPTYNNQRYADPI
jgi:hypothetical protein